MTVLEFSIQRLRERRTLVMGVAALMIYFAHVYSYADLGTFGAFFTYANWGVDVFLLVSGFGICHSMAKCPIAREFYWKRLVKVGVPYLVLAVPFYFASDILVAKQSDWGLFVLDVSTLSYWLFHRGLGMWPCSCRFTSWSHWWMASAAALARLSSAPWRPF